MSPAATRRLMAGLAGLGLLVAACASDDASANPTATTPSTSTTAMPATPSTEPTSTTTGSTATTTVSTNTSAEPTTTVQSATTIDEGQDRPVINDWSLEVESLPCEESDLPGSRGGEAVLPADWAAGNADFVNFIVDGDQRPANSVRDVMGPGNVQVPCDPALNDGHEVTMIAYTGTPGDPGSETVSQTLIVITTATKGN